MYISYPSPAEGHPIRLPLIMYSGLQRQLLKALAVPGTRLPFHHADQRIAQFSTSLGRGSVQDSSLKAENQKKTGIPPPYAPVGVAAALEASPDTSTFAPIFATSPNDPSTPLVPTPTIFEHEFSLKDRVALVSGANRGLGLEMSMALAEAGARAVYCVDLPKEPGDEWHKVKDYLARMKGKAGEGRLEYFSADVRDQV